MSVTPAAVVSVAVITGSSSGRDVDAVLMVLPVLVGLIGVRDVVEQLAEISTIASTTIRLLANFDAAGFEHRDE
jgi:hypothetical protein